MIIHTDEWRDEIVALFQRLGWDFDNSEGNYNAADRLCSALNDAGLALLRIQEHEYPATGVLIRDEDESGVSGTGVVAWVVEFPDGAAVTRWAVSDVRQTCIWDRIEHVIAIHGHDGKTRAVWGEDDGAEWHTRRRVDKGRDTGMTKGEING